MLIRKAFEVVAERLGTFEVASRKQPPGDVSLFGWCTWDAFYQAVNPAGLRAGLRALHAHGTPPRFMVIDDGWQSVTQDDARPTAAVEETEQKTGRAGADDAQGSGAEIFGDGWSEEKVNDPTIVEGDAANPFVAGVTELYRRHIDGADHGKPAVRLWRGLAKTVLREQLKGFFERNTPFSQRLAAFCANSKFEDAEAGTSLEEHLRALRAEFGSLRVYAWHTLGGYWGGVSTTSAAMAHLGPSKIYPRPTRSLLEVEPQLAWDAAALAGGGMVTQDRLSRPHFKPGSKLLCCINSI